LIYRFDHYRLDTDRLEFWKGEERVDVEPQVFSVLQCLVENCERVVSKEELVEQVWMGRPIADTTLSARISAARKAVGDSGKDQAVIRTVAKRGFRFVGSVAATPAKLNDYAAASKAPDTPAPEKPSIAVLPFTNMSGESDQDHIGDGIAEDIITALSKINRLRVIARNSTFAYKGKSPDVRDVAQVLNVQYVLEGSIRRSGDQLRVTAQLIDAADGSHLWAERYDHNVMGLFDIQDEIMKEIVTALQVRLTDGQTAFFISRGTNDIRAWELCARSTELFMRFNTSDYQEARRLAQQAVEIDSNYAYAWATLGFTYWWEGRLGYTGDSEQKYQRARQIADHDMTIDDTVSWVIGLSAMVAGAFAQHEQAVSLARRGVGLYPGNADVRAFLAFALMHAGQFRESLEHYRTSMQLNPFAPNWYRSGLTRSLIFLDQLDEALSLANDVLVGDPAYILSWLHHAYILGEKGDIAGAHAAVQEIRRLAPELRICHLSAMQLLEDNHPVTRRFVRSLRKAGLPES